MRIQFFFVGILTVTLMQGKLLAQESSGSVVTSWEDYHLTYCRTGCICPMKLEVGHMHAPSLALMHHEGQDPRAWVCHSCPHGKCTPAHMYRKNSAEIDQLLRDACISSGYSFKLRARNDAAYEYATNPERWPLQRALPRFGIYHPPTLFSVRDEITMLNSQCRVR